MKETHAIGKPARIAALLAACATLTLAIDSQAEDSPKYTMTAIKDVSFGRSVLKGRYDHAIERITARHARLQDAFESKTNLCVAYTKTGDLENATIACDSAVEKMRERTHRDALAGKVPQADRIYLAVALTNRGVLHVIERELDAARRSFEEASRLNVGFPEPHINLARLDLTSPDEG